MAATSVLLIGASGLAQRQIRPWHRGLMRLRRHSLDRRIAAGELVESGLLIAARARELVSDEHRSDLAGLWEDLPLRAIVQQTTSLHALRVSRPQVNGAAREISDLVALLRCDLPVSARAVAKAALLLTDGAGPVFRRMTPSLAAVLGSVIDATEHYPERRLAGHGHDG